MLEWWLATIAMPRLYNLNSHKELRKQLRRSASPAERRLWMYLKNDQLHGLRFRRQFGIGRYIVDFYCPKRRLVIEVDGSIHDVPAVQANDHERKEYLESCGIRIIRFTNDQVMNSVGYVLKTLEDIVTSPSALPYPPSEFRRGT